MGVLQRNDEWEGRPCYEDLLYLRVRRGTQVAQGRGLQNLHSWVRIPPAPPFLCLCSHRVGPTIIESVPLLYPRLSGDRSPKRCARRLLTAPGASVPMASNASQ